MLRRPIGQLGFDKTPVELKTIFWCFATSYFASPGLAVQALIRAVKMLSTLNIKRMLQISNNDLTNINKL